MNRTRVALIGCLTAFCAVGARALPIPAPDTSLDVRDYVLRGMPAPDRSWMPSDYERAAVLLEELAHESPPAFPRFESTKSGRLFSRIVSPDSLELASPAGASHEQKLALLVPLLGATNRIMSAYAFAARTNATYDDELVELYVFQFSEMQALVQTADDFIQSLPADDPSLAVRREGFSRACEGLGTTIAGLAETLGEREMYRPGSRLRLAQFLIGHVSAISNFIPTNVALETPIRLRQTATSEPDPPLREAISSLADSFTEALRPAA